MRCDGLCKRCTAKCSLTHYARKIARRAGFRCFPSPAATYCEGEGETIRQVEGGGSDCREPAAHGEQRGQRCGEQRGRVQVVGTVKGREQGAKGSNRLSQERQVVVGPGQVTGGGEER
ncbi:hypothetical protein AMAG_18802 [Allomyces macrogynus ATCC 38327]|uniref:Uncharacterized protein n=1 Tax=Allomyces macrogynus (strain ATCC 38327) TaxID=578462 RepID=A0A0L0SHW1_ALLM3|nr:hypothetical protein AMAG_18802 [Allomyces macrogynus ATCC 38327]|eukprot:KNE62037.1 hypothetical protein AMAG_18802 [Allomyces macrogynus ATCC 38327]